MWRKNAIAAEVKKVMYEGKMILTHKLSFKNKLSNVYGRKRVRSLRRNVREAYMI